MKHKNFEEINGNYYLGLDIGTDSVGYAVTDKDYNLIKYRGEPMIGSHLFDGAEDKSKRRSFRTARRRLDRKQQRVTFVRELFAREIASVDPDFYNRLDCSALYEEDKLTPSANSFFNDADYKDRDYHNQYPTIQHLIKDLIESKQPHDVRLLYLAVAYLVSHRGHFLNEADKDNIDKVLDFNEVYGSFMAHFDEEDRVHPWDVEKDAICQILKKKIGINKKEKELNELTGIPKKNSLRECDAYDRLSLIKLLAGGKVNAKDLFCKDEYEDLKLSLTMKDEELEAVYSQLGDDGTVVMLAKNIYDWSLLTDLLKGEEYLSFAKVKAYEEHKRDLKFLKYFIRNYKGDKVYNEVFREYEKSRKNYASYSGNVKNSKLLGTPEKIEKASKEDFCKWIKGIVNTVQECNIDNQDAAKYQDMIQRLENCTFMPKQVDGDNRTIPYQLSYHQLKVILENAGEYLPFLQEKDADGLTVKQKLLDVFMYRIPYFVGPLNNNSSFAWVVRKAGRITPWNFSQMVDEDASEQAFIDKLINTCTYLPGEKVLPVNSLVYSKFTVLNIINNLKIDGKPICVATKQKIYSEHLQKRETVTLKSIQSFLISNGDMTKEQILSGMDASAKIGMKSYHFFKPYMECGKLSYDEVEEIILIKAYSEDRSRLIKTLKAKFESLTDEDIKSIASKKFKEFGRLSRKFLCAFEGINKESGELVTVVQALWETNFNLMQIIASNDSFDFRERLENASNEYYLENPKTLDERLEEMYVPSGARRPIIRTLDIINDIKKVCGNPSKIFIEMARGATEEQKNKRTQSRKDQLYEYYDAFKGEYEADIRKLKEQLEGKEERVLSSDKIFLYFIQLGKCMYSGEPIDLELMMSNDKMYDIDHIYPRCVVKDDSLSNKVLVKSSLNGEKGDKYPISVDIQHRMGNFWKSLEGKKLVSEEKYKRLTRTDEIKYDERMGFINRQLVETRQATKAVAQLLKETFEKCEIVYVKAGLVSEFRQEFDLLKSRTVNDLHHAKDAYLNIVVGNVYRKFTSEWFKNKLELEDIEYSMKTETIFSHYQYIDGEKVWEGKKSIGKVKEIVKKNNIHLTKYAMCKKGGLFDQMPLKAGKNDVLVPRKLQLDISKYGGYDSAAIAFFVLAEFSNGKNKEVIFVPVELMFANKFINDNSFALNYVSRFINQITKKKPKDVKLLLKGRIIKIYSIIELDGVRVVLTRKSSGGKQIGVSSLISLKFDSQTETYIKRLESFDKSRSKNPKIQVDPKHDKITNDSNIQLYSAYVKKLQDSVFNKILPSGLDDILISGLNNFSNMSLEEQVSMLLNIGLIFKSTRTGGCNLEAIGGSRNSGIMLLSSRLSNWQKKYKEAYIIDSSASGLFETPSCNLLDLLKEVI